MAYEVGLIKEVNWMILNFIPFKDYFQPQTPI